MPVRNGLRFVYGQVAGAVTVTLPIVAPSVTLITALPPGSPLMPPALERLIDSVLPETTAVTLLLVEFTK